MHSTGVNVPGAEKAKGPSPSTGDGPSGKLCLSIGGYITRTHLFAPMTGIDDNQ
jgi:hypothetical protein